MVSERLPVYAPRKLLEIPALKRLKRLEARVEEIEALLEIFKTEKGQLKIRKLSVSKKDTGNKLKIKYEK